MVMIPISRANTFPVAAERIRQRARGSIFRLVADRVTHREMRSIARRSKTMSPASMYIPSKKVSAT